MQFNEYLRLCREKSHLTQEQLAHGLYAYDDIGFDGIDTNTISRWERGASSPKLPRQVGIIKYFQTLTDTALPCWGKYSTQEAEALICETGMQNLLGKSRELILTYPSSTMQVDDLSVSQLRGSRMIDTVIDIHKELDGSFHSRFKEITPDQLKSWAVHNANSFYHGEYKGQFFGLLFILRLKPESFEKMMRLEIREKDLREEDFASFEEMGSSFILSFFAMNDKVASMLFIRYYAHLITHQKSIESVGVAMIMKDAQKLLKNMNLHPCASLGLNEESTIHTYRETLPNFLASEYVVKMILSKRSCPEA